MKLCEEVELVAGKMVNTTATCPPKTMAATSNGVWQGDVPIHFALPLLIIQIVIVLCITRALAFALKPLKQPRVIAEIIVSSRPSIDVVTVLHSNEFLFLLLSHFSWCKFVFMFFDGCSISMYR